MQLCQRPATGFTQSASTQVLLGLAIGLPLTVLSVDFSYRKRNLGKSFWYETETWTELPGALLELFTIAIPAPAFAIIVAWTMLAVQRRWRNEPSWIDRAGRVLGVAWVLAGTAVAAILFGQM